MDITCLYKFIKFIYMSRRLGFFNFDDEMTDKLKRSLLVKCFQNYVIYLFVDFALSIKLYIVHGN